jgi:hypothetical protein
MIMAEEKKRERFLDRNNRENNRDNSDRRKFSNIGHPNKKRGPDNTIAMVDKMIFLKNLGGSKTLRICIVYGTRKKTTQQEITEKEKIRIKKRITRRKTKTTQKTKVSNSRREHLE